MKTITINVSDEQYETIMQVCRKRKKSFRALVLRIFFELDYADGRKEKR